MELAKLGANERLAAVAGLVVTMTGFLSAASGWGAILVLAILAGVGAIGVVVAPQLAPTARLPGSNGSLLVLLGTVAVLSWIPPLIAWLDWIVGHLVSLDTIVFLVGFVFALVLGWTGWVAFRAEGGKLRLGVQAPPAIERSTASDAHEGRKAADSEAEPGP